MSDSPYRIVSGSSTPGPESLGGKGGISSKEWSTWKNKDVQSTIKWISVVSQFFPVSSFRFLLLLSEQFTMKFTILNTDIFFPKGHWFKGFLALYNHPKNPVAFTVSCVSNRTVRLQHNYFKRNVSKFSNDETTIECYFLFGYLNTTEND